MAEQQTPDTGRGGPGGHGIQVRVVGQYIKDLSFESPIVTKLLTNPPEQPTLNVEINVNATNVGEHLYESAISFKALAKATVGTIYECELVYAGVFKIENAPAEALEPMLNVNCPALLFPFMRRIVADITREGGFPPLLLDPVDFASLFIRKREAMRGAPAGRPLS